MIYRIYSNLDSFKNLVFHKGLNIVLSEKSKDSTELQTRNRAGKTSLIEIIHFLTGAIPDTTSLFKVSPLVNYYFGMDFDLGNVRVSVERTGQNPNEIKIKSLDENIQRLKNFQLLQKNLFGEYILSNESWRSVLGNIMFGINNSQDGGEEDVKFGPTFRSVFPYFVRRQLSGGFVNPVKHSEQQQIGSQQVSVSFLLGVDWTISQQLQVVRDDEKKLRTLKRTVEKGTFGDVLPTADQLRAQLAVAESRANRLREALNQFNILPEYHSFETEATTLTVELAQLEDENTLDLALLSDLEKSVQSETSPSIVNLQSLYDEVGITLPNIAIRRFEEVQEFHNSIVQNRRSYLNNEIISARQRISEREERRRRLENRRSEVMNILKSHGALEQFARLTTELSKLEAETESIRQKSSVIEQLDRNKTELEINRGNIYLRLQQDYQEQQDVLKRAILAFEEISSRLYEEAGTFTPKASPNGPQFDIEIHGKLSKGIANMQIFCFDMMLMLLWSERKLGPGFLVHDSHLFDGVDARQIAKALEIGIEMAERFDFQYIVTMNSDTRPDLQSLGPNLDPYILPVQLTDAEEIGGLFGLRFK